MTTPTPADKLANAVETLWEWRTADMPSALRGAIKDVWDSHAAYRQSQQAQGGALPELQTEIDRLRHALDTVYQRANEDYWVWMGDGNDHLESMSDLMCVLIRAHQLRKLLGERLPPGVTLRKVLRMAGHFRVCGCHSSNTEGIHGKSWATYAALKKAAEVQKGGKIGK